MSDGVHQGVPARDRPSVLRSKLFWVGILYFAQGFPAGVFYELLPVHFRGLGVNLSEIGFLSLLGLGWTLKFLWAPAVSHFRHYRLWMLGADLLMAVVMLGVALAVGFGPWVWFAVGLFVVLSATNDIAIDGYTIELLNKDEMGIANGFRIGFYRVGLLSAGGLLMLQGWLGWTGVYLGSAVILVFAGALCFRIPKEKDYAPATHMGLFEELRSIYANPFAFSAVITFLLACLWMVNRTTHWSRDNALFWPVALGIAVALVAIETLLRRSHADRRSGIELSEGPMFGALFEMVRRPDMLAVFLFVLTFKLADTTMGFMVKPFWVDAGFTPAEIGLVSVNVGIALSIGGGIAGGWFTDRVGIFHGLWMLGLTQAVSNLGYAYVAHVLPVADPVMLPGLAEKALMYTASAVESFTQGLGTAAFLAFLMAIVDKRRSATEYALLSSLFIFSRSVAGWVGGFGAERFGYPDFFVMTFFLAIPAYFLLPWVRRMLAYAESRTEWDQSS